MASREVPAADFVKSHYKALIQSFHTSISADQKSRAQIASGSNMEALIEVWAEDASGAENTEGIKSPLKILSDLLLAKVNEPVVCELHPSTGDQKVIFDKENNFYITVVKEGDKLLIAGLGSVLGNHITAQFEAQLHHE